MMFSVCCLPEIWLPWQRDVTTCPLFCPGGLCEKERGKCFTGVKSVFSCYFQRAYHPRMEVFFQSDTFLGFGCNATAVSDAGIWHDSSSGSGEVRVGRVKLISFDDITTKLGPILRSAQ